MTIYLAGNQNENTAPVITAADGSKWTSVPPSTARGGVAVRVGNGGTAAARLAADLAAAQARTAAAADLAAARRTAALAAAAGVAARVNAAILADRQAAAHRKTAAALALKAAAAAADVELAAGERQDSDNGTDGGYAPPTKTALAQAAQAAAQALARHMLAAARRDGADTRQAAMAAAADSAPAWRRTADTRTTAGRDNRRAAVHAAHTHAPLSDAQRTAQRDALANALAQGCKTQAWAGNGQATQYLRQRANRALVTASVWNRTVLAGTDARRGIVAWTPASGAVSDAVQHDTPVVAPTEYPADLSHWQHGTALVLSGTPTGVTRDDSYDAAHGEIVAAARTAAAAAGVADVLVAAAHAADRTVKTAHAVSTGTVALAQGMAGQHGGYIPLPAGVEGPLVLSRPAGMTGLQAWQAGQALITADDDARQAAHAAAAAAARLAAAAAAARGGTGTARTVHPPRACGLCGATHAAIVACHT